MTKTTSPKKLKSIKSAKSSGSTPVDIPELDCPLTSALGCQSQVDDCFSAGPQFIKQGPKSPSTNQKGSSSRRGKDVSGDLGLSSCQSTSITLRLLLST